MIDLRSDTVTRPTPEMREAMARAEVGDDVFGEDPTVNRLQERAAGLLGKEAALFVPSGTMANQLCLRAQTEPGDEVVMDAGGHSFNFETGAAAALCGAQVHPVHTERGIFGPDELDAAVRPQPDYYPRSSLVCIENTHNYGGGTVWPLEALARVVERARHHGLRVHLDGARLMNACVASGVSAADFAASADSVSLCFSKGLGAPVGSILAGDRALVDRCHRFRKQFGGGMRQAGILAAAALHALDHHVDRLADDHANARRLADGLATVEGLALEPGRVETNIVFIDVEATRDLDAAALAAAVAERGVAVSPTAPRTLRLVTHLDVSAPDVEVVVGAFRDALAAS